MFEGLFLRIEYDDWLEKLQGDRAVVKNLTECQRCGFCCAARPCMPTPKDLRAIAKHLKMTLKECVSTYFVVDRFPAESIRDVLFLFPAKTEQKDLVGKLVPKRRTFDKGYCIFFDEENKNCIIHPVIPDQAKNYGCWSEPDPETTAEKVIETWRGVDLSEFGVDVSKCVDPDDYDWDDDDEVEE